MKKYKPQMIGFGVGCLVVIVGFWLGGFDFNQRGDKLVSAYLLAFMVGTFGMILTMLWNDR